jgi:hypothetical protein
MTPEQSALLSTAHDSVRAAKLLSDAGLYDVPARWCVVETLIILALWLLLATRSFRISRILLRNVQLITPIQDTRGDGLSEVKTNTDDLSGRSGLH